MHCYIHSVVAYVSAICQLHSELFESNADLLFIPADVVSTPKEHWKKYLYPEDNKHGDELVLTEEVDQQTGDAPLVATEKSPLLPKSAVEGARVLKDVVWR